jgi:hypothetical protein
MVQNERDGAKSEMVPLDDSGVISNPTSPEGCVIDSNPGPAPEEIDQRWSLIF